MGGRGAIPSRPTPEWTGAGPGVYGPRLSFPGQTKASPMGARIPWLPVAGALVASFAAAAPRTGSAPALRR